MSFDAFVQREAAAVAAGGPFTVESLTADLRALGITPGMTFIVHSSLSQIGWVVGGAQAALTALLAVAGEGGTILMPAFSTHNTDPSHWQNPPIPASWWPIVRDHAPAYDPALTPTRGVGKIPELFRTWPGVQRSAHPAVSFAAHGPNADVLLADHTPGGDLGPNSPIGRLYDLDGHILLLGVGHGNNTSLHLAEYRARFPGKHDEPQGCAMMVDGERRWFAYSHLAIDDEDFPQLGAAYEAAFPSAVTIGRVGRAECRLMRQRPLVDFAVGWLEANRR